VQDCLAALPPGSHATSLTAARLQRTPSAPPPSRKPLGSRRSTVATATVLVTFLALCSPLIAAPSGGGEISELTIVRVETNVVVTPLPTQDEHR
jgi:hypothetical protein